MEFTFQPLDSDPETIDETPNSPHINIIEYFCICFAFYDQGGNRNLKCNEIESCNDIVIKVRLYKLDSRSPFSPGHGYPHEI